MVALGFRFCFDVLKLLVPTFLVHASLRLLSYAYSWNIPAAIFIVVSIFTLPAYYHARTTCIYYLQLRETRRLGAELVPSLRGKWPGNLDILYNSLFRKTMYPGDSFMMPVGKLGTTYAITIAGDTKILTINPENVKRILATDFTNYVKGVSFNT